MGRIYLLLLTGIMFAAVANGQITVTGADATTNSASPFATLAAAFTSINANNQTGFTISITITANTTEAPVVAAPSVVLNGGAWNSISIQPSGGAWTISGAATAGFPLIDFNGADNVNVNGLNSGGNSLTISNTTVSATSGTSTIRFQTDASNNIITNCTILGSATMAVGTNGGNIWFGSAAVTTGSDNNTISSCDIGPAGANLPSKALYFSGSSNTDPGTGNSGNSITNCNIFDFFSATVSSAGIDLNSGTPGAAITNNRFYQTATRTMTTTSLTHSGIRISNSLGNGYNISGNTFGFASNTGTGTYTLVLTATSPVIPINLSVGATTATSVQGNTIAGIAISGASSGTSSSGAFRGIYVDGGLTTIGNVTGNTIGSQSSTGSITYTSSSTSASDVMGFFNFGSANWTVSNNTVGGIVAANSSTGASNVYGIRLNTSSTASTTIQNNTIGGAVANSLQSTTTATGSQVAGIFISTSLSTVTGNTIRNLNAAGGTGTTTAASVVGIAFVSTSVNHTVTQNNIHTLNNTNVAAATTLTGIQYTSSTGTNLISRNIIHSFNAASPAAIMNGIQVSGGTSTYQNNMIRLGIDENGLSIAVGCAINGINEPSGTDNFYFNSIFIGGAGVGGAANTFAFNSTVTTNTRNFRNNIFQNARSNGAGTGIHYAAQVGGTTPNPAGLTINNNVYFVSGTGGVFGRFTSANVANLAAWKTAVGQDANSFESDPQFINPLGTSSSVDLHIHPSNTTVIEGNGFPIGSVTDDYDGQNRSVLGPVDIGADAGNFAGIDLTGPAISYTLLINTTSTGNQSFTAVTITDATGVNGTLGTRPRVYYKRGTDANALNDNTSGTDGWKYVEASGTSSPFDFTIDYSLLNGGTGVSAGTAVQYFVVAQDLAPTPNVNINSGTFAAAPSSVALTSAAFPIGGTINSYLISVSYSGIYNVGTGQTYLTLTNAGGFFAAINAGVVSGNITVNIVSNLTEDGTNALNQWTEEGVGGYTLTIQPDAATERIISGAVANGMIRFNGADRVTIEGRFGGSGTFLRFRNTNTSNPTFTFVNDATNNTIRYSIIESANTITSSGTILFSTSSGTLGNSNNTINNCEIRDRSDAAGVPANAVFSVGSAGAPNANNTVSGCNVFNWTNAGVFVAVSGAGDGWVINPSSFYQTSARTTPMTAIGIYGGSGHSILNNSIGGTAPNAGGTNLVTSSTFRGIDLSVGTASATSVQGNTIKNIRSTLTGSFTASYGILLAGGMANIGNLSGNTVGSSNAAERFEISGDSYGIRAISTSTVNLSNNTVNNFTTAPTAPTGQFYFGMSVEGTGGIHSVINNTVMKVTNASTPDASFSTQTIGMTISATGVQTIRGNTIHDIGNTSTTAPASNNNRVWGLIISATPVGTVVEKNNIYNIYGSSTATGARADVITLLQSQSVANATYSNNMASSGTVNNSSDRFVFGILDLSAAPAVSNYYFNSVSITGTATGANNTYAFNRNSTATVSITNNIFSNARSGGTGFHVSIANTNAAATGWAASASNYNDLYSSTASTTAQWLGALLANNRDLPGWQAAQAGGSGGDANSISILPGFTSATNLHINVNDGYPHDNLGTAISIDEDIDAEDRSNTTPDLGADEFTGVPGDISPPVISYTPAGNICTGGSVTLTATIIDPGSGVPTAGAGLPVLYWRINAGAYTAATGTFVSGNTYQFSFGSGGVGGDVISYYVAAQDLAGTPNVAVFPAAGASGFTPNPPAASTPPTTPGSLTVLNNFSGIFTVGAAGAYPSLTAAVADYNSRCLNGPVVFNLIEALYSASETFPITINANPGSSSTNTLTIRPSGGVAASIAGTPGNAIIKLNGADYVIIDGLNTGGSSLSIVNTNATTSGLGIWIGSASASDGATNNIIRNTTITGNSGTTTLVGILSGNASTAGNAADFPNSNNTIQACTLSKWGNALFLLGNPSLLDKSWVVTQNIIGSTVTSDKGFRGIAMQNAQDFTISSNTITGATNAGTGTASGILAGGVLSGGNINNNIIRDVSNTNSGGWGSNGIFLNSSSTAANVNVFDNFISEVFSAGYSSGAESSDNGYGIMVGAGAGYGIWHNTVHMNTSQTNNGLPAAFNVSSTVTEAGAIDLRNNIFSNTQTVGTNRYSIHSGAANTVFSAIDYNDYYTTGPNLGFIGSNRATLSDIQTGFGGNTASENIQPFFVSATDLHINPTLGYTLDNQGTPAIIAAVPTDIDGTNWNLPTDMGADEFTGVAPACGDVTGLAASNITTSSVDLNWNATGAAVGYQFAVTTSATPPGSGTPNGGTSVSVGSLLSATVYYAHVRTECAGSIFGNWATISFTTLCPNATLPLSQGFNTPGPSVFPVCWSQQQVVGTSDITFPTSSSNPNTDPFEGTRYAFWNSYNIAAGNETRLVSQGITTTGTASVDVEFQWKNDNNSSFSTGAYLNEGVQAQYSLDGGLTWTDAGAFIPRHDGTLPVGTSQWNTKTINLPAGAGNQAAIYVGFKFHSEFGDNCSLDAALIQATPICFAPTGLTVLATSATIATVSWTAASPAPSNGYEWKIVLAGAGSGGTAQASGSTGAGIVTDNATGLATGIMYDLFVRSNCGTGFSSYAGPRTFTLNDDAAGAITITVGATCTGDTYTNLGATQKTGEPSGTCSSTTGFETVWYKFQAPASGAVRITTDIGITHTLDDSRIALFSTTNVNDYSTFTILSCDEDGGDNVANGGINEFMSVLYATGLQNGQFYYVQVDRYVLGTSGTFCLEVAELNSTMLASANTCASTYQTPFGSVATYTGWVPLMDVNSKLVALVQNPAGGPVNQYVPKQNINTLAVRTDAVSGQKYLNRNFQIENTTGVTNVNVRLLFLDTELAALQAVDNAATLANLGVTRQTSTTCQIDFDASSGTNSQLPQTSSGSVNGVSWISFTTPGFSNFFIHTSKAPVTLKTFLQGAFDAGVQRHKNVTTAWRDVLRDNATSQPYNILAFGNYNGGENVSSTMFNSTAGTTDIMDWVLLELRNAAPPAARIAARAAFILEDGTIVDLDGISSVSFRGVADGNYFITVRHRNHLGIRTASVQLINGALGNNPAPGLYDYSLAQANAFQDPAIIANNAAMGNDGSVFLMWAGNANQDNFVRVISQGLPTPIPGDGNYILGAILSGNPSATFNGYSEGDVNMDGRVRATTQGLPTPIPGDTPFILGTPLGGNPAGTRREHK